MVDGRMTGADRERFPQRARQVLLGARDGRYWLDAKREIGGDCGRECAAGSVRVDRLDSWSGDALEHLSVIDQVRRVV